MIDRYCLTYFRVMYNESDFDSHDFMESLGLPYSIFERFGTENSIEIGRNDIYDVDINNMLRVTLKDLFGKEEVLLRLKKKYNLEYYLERVPSVFGESDDPNPILSLSRDIIEFLYKTETIDDLDYYVY